MKKLVISLILMVGILLSTASPVFAEDGYVDDIPNSSHKIMNKWDATGSFTSLRDNVSSVGTTWTYEIHVKQAMYGPYSKGVIEFVSGDKVITAHVTDVKEDYAYWAIPYASDNFAAVGWAEYNGATYNFMLLYSEGGIWIILSNLSYDARWATEDFYQGTERVYQLLSAPWYPDGAQFDFEPKLIH